MERIEPALRRALSGHLPADEVADAEAEAFAYAWQHRDRVMAMENPGGYLYRVAQSKSRRRKQGFLPWSSDAHVPEIEPGLPPPSPRCRRRSNGRCGSSTAVAGATRRPPKRSTSARRRSAPTCRVRSNGCASSWEWSSMGELEDQIAASRRPAPTRCLPYEAPASLDRAAHASRRGVSGSRSPAAITAHRGRGRRAAVGPRRRPVGPHRPHARDRRARTDDRRANHADDCTAGAGNVSRRGGRDDEPEVRFGRHRAGYRPRRTGGREHRIRRAGAPMKSRSRSGGGSPSWSIEYRAGPLTLEPSGLPSGNRGHRLPRRPVRVRAGRALGQRGRRNRSVPDHCHTSPQVRQTQDFEGIVTWVIGLDEQLPFTATERDAGQGGRTLAIVVPRARRSPRRDVLTPARIISSSPCRSVGTRQLSDDVRCQTVALEPGCRPDRARLCEPQHQHRGAVRADHADDLDNGGRSDGVTAWKATTAQVPITSQRDSLASCARWRGETASTLTVTTNGYAGPRYAEYKAGVQAIVASARYLPVGVLSRGSW